MEKEPIVDFPSTERSRALAKKYGYSEFIVRRFLNLYEDAEELIKAMETPLPEYIRINTLKVDEERAVASLENRGFILKKTPYRYVYEVVESPFSHGATPEYLMGHYYIQDASSAVPPLVLDPKPDDVVVDMCASPGGKTTLISQLMENRGVVIAVEVNRMRLDALIHNIHRCGVLNTIVLHRDARTLPLTGIKADRVLLDAPCTGEGIIHKDPSRKKSRGMKDLMFCSTLQRELMVSALEILKKDGILVYSTCSLAPEENEMVIQSLLDRFPIELMEVEYGSPGLEKAGKYSFSREMKKTRRFYPHLHRTSGFFVAKIRLKRELIL